MTGLDGAATIIIALRGHSLYSIVPGVLCYIDFNLVVVGRNGGNAMAYVPALNTVQAELIYNWDLQICENVLHFEAAGAISQPNMTDLGAFLVNYWDTELKASMPTNLSLTKVRLTDLTLQTGPVIEYTTGLPILGTNASPSLPNNCALVLTKRTAFRGRSFRGRVYLPGLTEAFTTGNTVDPTFVTNRLADFNGLINFTAGTETWTMVVVSRISNGVERSTATLTPVLNFSSDGIVDSQRSRLPRRGN